MLTSDRCCSRCGDTAVHKTAGTGPHAAVPLAGEAASSPSTADPRTTRSQGHFPPSSQKSTYNFDSPKTYYSEPTGTGNLTGTINS